MVLPAHPEQVSTQALSPALVRWQPPCQVPRAGSSVAGSGLLRYQGVPGIQPSRDTVHPGTAAAPQLFALHEALPESSEERTGRITGPCSLLMDTRPWKQRASPSLRTLTSRRSRGTSENACDFEVRISVIVKVTGTADELGVVTRTREGNTKFPVENTQNKQAGATGGLCPRGRSGAAGPDSRRQLPALAVRVLGGEVQNLPSCGHRPPVFGSPVPGGRWDSRQALVWDRGLGMGHTKNGRARGLHELPGCSHNHTSRSLSSAAFALRVAPPGMPSALSPPGQASLHLQAQMLPPFRRGGGGHWEVGSPPEGGRIPGGRVPAACPSSSASVRVPDSVPCLCPRGCSCRHLLPPPSPTGHPSGGPLASSLNREGLGEPRPRQRCAQRAGM
ncbi:uncharacterized protein LOC125090377 isoform X2 [Lutra lutra]|uniref:uncharacterized protein LOC125090377 isoform X2 n=1 Tax=Lutra lutra TaxID=9657 RepID=UPI001FD01C9A|nr:uncharacterized protein LOC125090377 isoform X2 [Lutra lutra]XP_047568954.1 uncharacterized protein LOC125090377 isoform X2 [Lutra lutra]